MITSAAVKMIINNTQEVVIPLHRHGDIGIILKSFGFKPHQGYTICSQGFLTQNGLFLDRSEAWLEAVRCGQVEQNDNYCNELFSEDLY